MLYIKQNIQIINLDRWTFYVRTLAPGSAAPLTLRCGTLVNMHQTQTWKIRNCYIKSLFWFSLRTKISRSFIKVWLSH